jgi:hypothetical protein
VYQEVLSETSPEYDYCPRICARFPKRPKDQVREFCGGCEVGIAKKAYEEASLQYLNEQCGDDWKKYRFEDLHQTVVDIWDEKSETKSIRPVNIQILVNILQSEINHQEKIREWNRRQAAKQNE